MTMPPLPDSLHDVAWDLLPKTALESVITKYGQQCREAALEQAAEVCDNHAFGWEKNPGDNPLAGFIAASNCAGAVRNLK